MRGSRLAIIATLSLAGCAGHTRPADPLFLGSTGTTQDVRVPVASMLARKFNTVVRQQYDFSCGSAALATLLRYHYDVPRSEGDVFMGMWKGGDQARIRQVGFSLLDMKRYLADQRMRAEGYRVTLDDIARRGLPGIALVTYKGYRHFVVVKGVQGDRVLVGDPSLGIRTVSRAEFAAIWNQVYFVLVTDAATGQRNFNGTRQWSVLAPAPLGAPFLDPLSQGALALAAPFYRDF